MKTEEQVNQRIRDLFAMGSSSVYGYDRDKQMSEIAVLHWVIDNKAIHRPITEKKKRHF